MTNLEIDRKLAEAMGYKELVENGYLWEPSVDMSDAWEVAERFGVEELKKTDKGLWAATIYKHNAFGWFMETAETAPLAICKAALKVIENGR
jgi:hypothetical protein